MALTYHQSEPALASAKERFLQYAFDLDAQSSSAAREIDSQTTAELDVRDRLSALLTGELDFQGEDGGYASHDLHAFAAKFPPQLPRVFIRGLTERGQTVLDPMMGSGTALVEALVEGRYAVGVDLDPLALLLSAVKTTGLKGEALVVLANHTIARARQMLGDQEELGRTFISTFDETTRAFFEYWFEPATLLELASLGRAIGEESDPKLRRFLELSLSSIIVTKSGGVSRARDLAHSRPHRDETKKPRNALDQFEKRLNRNIRSLQRLPTGAAVALAGDARALPLRVETVDLVVTSPPYANAIDYMRAHKFSLTWFGRPVTELSRLRSRYIGAEKIRGGSYGAFPEGVEIIIRALEARDKSKAKVLLQYFFDMKCAMAEMYRVLKPKSAAVLVVGTSTMRGLDVQTHLNLGQIGETVGFELVGVARRALDRNKRMMPARFGAKHDSQIEQRMHEEFVVGFVKH